MKKIAIIVAGGSGSRMGSPTPKQFIELHGKPLLLHSMSAFREAYQEIEIILVLPEPYLEVAKKMIFDHQMDASVQLVAGGETRFHSVKNGLLQITDNALVFIHDAVRCLVGPNLIKRCGEAAMQMGSAIPVVSVRDSIRKKSSDGSIPISREDLLIVQTPQVFKSSEIIKAFESEYQPSFTDEATVYEAHGGKVYLVEGERANIKITYPEDLSYAEWLLSGNNRIQ